LNYPAKTLLSLPDGQIEHFGNLFERAKAFSEGSTRPDQWTICANMMIFQHLSQASVGSIRLALFDIWFSYHPRPLLTYRPVDIIFFYISPET